MSFRLLCMHSTSFTHIAIVWRGGRVYSRGGVEGVGEEPCGQLLLRRLLLPLQLYSNIRHKLSLKMLGKKFSLFRKLLLPFWPTQRAPFPATEHAAATALLLITSIRSVHTHTHTHSLTWVWKQYGSSQQSAICCGSSLLAAPFIGYKPEKERDRVSGGEGKKEEGRGECTRVL